MSKTQQQKTNSQTPDEQYRQEFKRRRPANLKFLAALVLFIFALVAVAVVVRLNHIKGLAD